MKKKKSAFLAALQACLAILSSCSAKILETNADDTSASEHSTLDIRILNNAKSKSSISPDENSIRDILVMAYRQEDGMLAATQEADDAESIEIQLPGGTYNIYVTANMKGFDVPVEEQHISNAYYRINSIAELDNTLPMCWKGSAELKTGKKTILNVSMSRLVSKIGFDIEKGVLQDLEIISVRLCQASGTIRPFMENGNRIMAQNEAVNGDYATEEDLKKLSSGESIYFYATENCQGTLLPDNTDPWSKTPVNIGEKAGLCTYVEMKGRWEENADYEGTVIYRFYLGENAESNFDIRRNSVHNLTLYLNEDSFDRISWKIDASEMEPANWDIFTDLSRNNHRKDNFYVTENIFISFALDEKGTRYWQKRNNRFMISGIDSNGGTIIRFDSPSSLGNGRFNAMGTCMKAGEYEIVLIDEVTGSVRYIMEHGEVKTPEVVAGNYGCYTNEKVEGFDEECEFIINGNTNEIYLYLTDSDGYNLNRGDFFGCDFSICNWKADISNKESSVSLDDRISVESIEGKTGSNSYAMALRISFKNDGKDESWNRILTESLGRGRILSEYQELTSGASCKGLMSLYCHVIDITFKPVPDSGKHGLGSEFMFAVDNPSKLPLLVRGLKLNSMEYEPTGAGIDHVLCENIYGNRHPHPLMVSPMPPTICSYESDSSKYAIIDGKECYAVNDGGTEQSDIPHQMAMFHTFEVKFKHPSHFWDPEAIAHMDMYGTQSNRLKYGQDGYMNCGCIFYSGRGASQIFDANNGARTDFKQYGDLLKREYISRFLNIISIDMSINEKNEIMVSASRDADIDIAVSGSLNGHIRCVTIQDPFFTVWGHYFKESQVFKSVNTVTVGKTPSEADAYSLTEAYESMRAIQYYSTLDAWEINDFRDPTRKDIVREYLKPYDLDLNIGITSRDGAPARVRLTGSVHYNYKNSSPVTWSTGIFSSVTMVPSSYSGFDSRLDDDGCPPGSLFKAETVHLEPDVSLSNKQGLFILQP